MLTDGELTEIGKIFGDLIFDKANALSRCEWDQYERWPTLENIICTGCLFSCWYLNS